MTGWIGEGVPLFACFCEIYSPHSGISFRGERSSSVLIRAHLCSSKALARNQGNRAQKVKCDNMRLSHALTCRLKFEKP